MLTAGGDVTTIVDLVPDRRARASRSATRCRSAHRSAPSVAAWSDAPTVERWLTPATHPRPLRHSYLDLLDAVRERGFAVELTGTVDARIYEVLAQIGGRYGEGTDDAGTIRLRALLDELVGEVGGPGGLPPHPHRARAHLPGRHDERPGLRPRRRGRAAAGAAGPAGASWPASRSSTSAAASWRPPTR